MDLKQIAKDTTKTLISYLTYQAMRTVMDQLSETDPPRSLRLHEFSRRERIENSEAYLEVLFTEDQALAFRILTVREHIAEEIAEYLPEMLRTGIQQANTQQRCQQLERMTQTDPDASGAHPEPETPSPDPTDSTLTNQSDGSAE